MSLVQFPRQSVGDINGSPFVGANASFYLPGSSTPIALWTDSTYAISLPNPVPSDSDGRFPRVEIDPSVNPAYKLVILDPDGALVYSEDNLSSSDAGNILNGLLTQQFIGQTLYPRTPAELAALITPTNYYVIEGDVVRYGAAGDNSTNDAAAFSSSNSVGAPILVSHKKIYRIGTNTTLTAPLIIDGGQISVDSGVTLTINGPLEIRSSSPFIGSGYVVLNYVSRPARLANILPDRAAGVSVRGSCTYHAFGDSYTSGTGVTSATRYSAIFASRFNATETNHGVGGRGVTRANLEAYQNLPKYGARNCVITWMAGFNDLHYNPNNSKTLTKLTSEAKAFLANAYLRTAVPGDDSTVTRTGSWSNAVAGTWADKGSQSLGGHAVFSNTNADKISFTFTGTNVVVGYFQGNGVTYTLADFDVYIDSVFVETISSNATTDGNAGFPETYEGLTHAVLLYTALGSGSHTIELRLKSGNYVIVDYFGTLSSPGDCPSVLMAEIPHVDATGYASPEFGRSKTLDDAGSNAIRVAVTTFQSLGYPVAWVPINDYYNYQANIQSDHDHPNAVGHQQIAAAFSAYTYGQNYAVQPSCTFTKSATQSISNSTVTAVTFSAATDDLFGFRDSTNTSRIYAPFSGTMRLSGVISSAANATGIRALDVFKNGGGSATANILAWTGFLNNDNIFSFSVDIPMTAGEYAELKYSQNSGGSLNLQTNCRLDVCMIR